MNSSEKFMTFFVVFKTVVIEYFLEIMFSSTDLFVLKILDR